MCNREISSRRIDWFFPRSSTTIRGRSPGGVVPTPPDRPRYEKCPDRARVKHSGEWAEVVSVIQLREEEKHVIAGREQRRFQVHKCGRQSRMLSRMERGQRQLQVHN